MFWYFEVLRKYATFSGRARRKEYWMFVLVNFIISVGFLLLDRGTGLYDRQTQFGVFDGFYSLLVLLPSLAVSFRRLHDTGRSGWWGILLAIIPIVGWLVLLLFLVEPGNRGRNDYGPDPLARRESPRLARQPTYFEYDNQKEADQCNICGTALRGSERRRLLCAACFKRT
jgi:uncharacterized membrane protein YhaH (DUF805 family)